MIELHGWITLRESYEYDCENDNLGNIVMGIEKHINSMYFQPSELSLKRLNGVPSISITFRANRKTEEIKSIFDLLGTIADCAKGSYGLIYLHDDEDVDGKDNLFQVFVLARGIITEANDIFLSPFIPTVEDVVDG
jgi:hypothetical protein